MGGKKIDRGLFKGHEKNPHIEALGKYLNGVGRVYTSTHLSVLKALLKNTTSGTTVNLINLLEPEAFKDKIETTLNFLLKYPRIRSEVKEILAAGEPQKVKVLLELVLYSKNTPLLILKDQAWR